MEYTYTNVSISPEKFASLVNTLADKSKSKISIWHEIHYTKDGIYLCQSQENVLDDSGGCFYSANIDYVK